MASEEKCEIVVSEDGISVNGHDLPRVGIVVFGDFEGKPAIQVTMLPTKIEYIDNPEL